MNFFNLFKKKVKVSNLIYPKGTIVTCPHEHQMFAFNKDVYDTDEINIDCFYNYRIEQTRFVKVERFHKDMPLMSCQICGHKYYYGWVKTNDTIIVDRPNIVYNIEYCDNEILTYI